MGKGEQWHSASNFGSKRSSIPPILYSFFKRMLSKRFTKSKMKWMLGAIGLICLIGFTTGMVLFGTVVKPSEPFSPPSSSRLGKYRTAAVSSDGYPCSDVGKDVLAEGGNAVDSAIATLFCIGVVNQQSAGIGGGFLLTLYDPKTRTSRCLDARETAPLASNENMFNGSSKLSQKGGLAVAVPGELAGYWAAHQAYGRLPWARLIQPAANLAENGVKVNSNMAGALIFEEANIKAEPSMWPFLDNKGQLKKEGDIVKRPDLAATLRLLASSGVSIFYNGTLGARFVEDVKRRGGILTQQDLINYKAKWVDPIRVELKNSGLTLHTIPAPGSGALTAFILNILDGLLEPLKGDTRNPLIYHRIAEAFKHAYAQRTKVADPAFSPEVYDLMRNLTSETWARETRAKINDNFTSNDPEFYGAVLYNPDDHGTSHVSVLDSDGMAVSATSTVNLRFGAGFISESTGIIPNDEMDDFSSPNITNFFGVPPSPANFIRPGKRPLSSMTPSIMVDSITGRVRSVLGAAGGTKITTSVAYVMIRNLWFNETIKEAIDSRRMHHQLFPMAFQFEEGFPKSIVNSMENKLHNTSSYSGGSAVCGIYVQPDGIIQANSDFRKYGDVAGIDPLPSS